MIELVAVILVVGLLAATTVTTLDSIANRQAGVAASAIMRDLTHARQRAVATGTPCWVVFDVAGDSWSLLTEDPDNPGRVNATALADFATGADWTGAVGAGDFAGVSITGAAFDGAAEIGFDWLGRPLNDQENFLVADGRVTLSPSQTIDVKVETGHITKQ